MKTPLAVRLLAVALAAGVTLSDAHAAPPAKPAAKEGEFPTLEAVEREVAKLVERARPSVVGVIARSELESLMDSFGGSVRLERDSDGNKMARRIGTGIVLDEAGHVATLSAVVSGARDIIVIDADGVKVPARVKGLDGYSGLAVLVLESPAPSRRLRPVVFGDSEDLQVGSLVTTVSGPSNVSDGSAAYSFGFVAGTGISPGPGRQCPYIKIDAKTAAGAGGGPVFDSKGRVVGVLFGAGDEARGAGRHVLRWRTQAPGGGRAEYLDEEAEVETIPLPELDKTLWLIESLNRPGHTGDGMAYAVPARIVKRVTNQIIHSGSARRGWVGLKIEESEPGEIRLLGVVSDSPADRAGLVAGDRIVALDGAPVKTAEQLVEAISSSAAGTVVQFGLQRGHETLNVAVTLGESPDIVRTPVPPTPLAVYRRSPQLGVELDLSDDYRRLASAEAPEGVGLKIKKVHEATRAQAAGLMPGDLLVEAMGESLKSLVDLRRALGRQGDSDLVLTVLRDGRTLQVRVPPMAAGATAPSARPRRATPPPPAPAPPPPPS